MIELGSVAFANGQYRAMCREAPRREFPITGVGAISDARESRVTPVPRLSKWRPQSCGELGLVQ